MARKLTHFRYDKESLHVNGLFSHALTGKVVTYRENDEVQFLIAH